MSEQKTLTGESADTFTEEDLDEISFYYYSTNYTPVFEDAKAEFREDCVEQAIEYFQLSSQVKTNSLEEDALENMAEEFVSAVFDSVWSMIDDEGYSLWIEVDDGFEMPIYIKAPLGMFTSASSLGSYGEGKTEVSDEFLKSVGQMVEEKHNGWSNCEEEVFEQLTETEKKLYVKIREAFTGMTDMSPEISMLIEKGKQI